MAAEASPAASVSEDDFQQSETTVPGASRNSMLVTTDSLQDIAQYLDGDISEAELHSLKLSRQKSSVGLESDPGGGGGAANSVSDSGHGGGGGTVDSVEKRDDDTESGSESLDDEVPESSNDTKIVSKSDDKKADCTTTSDSCSKGDDMGDDAFCETRSTADKKNSVDPPGNLSQPAQTLSGTEPEEVSKNSLDNNGSLQIDPHDSRDEANCDTELDISQVTRKLSSLSNEDENQGVSETSDETDINQSRLSPEETPPELEYVNSAQWRNHEKHVFILSRAGKPIYSRYGDEDRLVTLMGVMQALASFVQSSKDTLRYMVAGDHKFVYLIKEHLILVAIAQTGESHPHLLLQLTYVYNQVLSILTQGQLNRIFSTLHNYDLRRLLSGTEKLFDNLLNVMNRDASFFLGAVRCLPLEASVRDTVAQSIAQNAKVKDLVFGILISDSQLVTLVRMKRYFLHPVDLHLIFNLVNASESFKTAESWTPICLPKFDTNGYLHAYISYLDESCQTCLLLFTVDKDLFFTLADCKKKILEKLNKHQCLKTISESIRRGNFTISQTGIPGLRHFLYKSRSTAQFTSPQFEAPYTADEDRQRIFRLYQYLHQRLHSSSRPLKILFHIGPYETLLGWVTSGFELYAAFGPLVTKPVAINSINKLLKWIKKEEDRLFILNSPTF